MKGETPDPSEQVGAEERDETGARLARRAQLLRDRQEAIELRQRLHPRRTHLDRIRWLAHVATFRRT